MHETMMVEPKQGNTARHRLDMEAYQAYTRKDHVAHIMMLRNMRNDIMLGFERHRSTQSVWDAVKIQYGGTSTTRFYQLTLKFDGYKKHLTVMSNMIDELKGMK